MKLLYSYVIMNYLFSNLIFTKKKLGIILY